MIEAVRVIKTEKTVYIAKDGREFDNLLVCETYERAMEEEKLYAVAESLPHFEYNPPTADVDTTNVWSYCKNMEELDAVMVKYLCEEEREHYYDTELEDQIPGWVVTATDDKGYGYIAGAEKTLGEYEDFILEVIKLMSNGGDET